MQKIKQFFSKTFALLPEEFSHKLWRNAVRNTFGKKLLLKRFYSSQIFEITSQGMDFNCNPKVLLLHGLQANSRQTTVDYVSAFRGADTPVDLFAANIFGFLPSWLGEVDFDLVVLTNDALASRSATSYWHALEERIFKATKSAKKIVLMPQDDYTDSKRLDDLAIKLSVSTIYSPLTRGLDLIYPKATAAGVQFVEALTGYFEQEKLEARASHAIPFRDRTITVGQRVMKLPPQFGDIGIRKFQIADDFCSLAEKKGLTVDFSAAPGDVLLGEDWFKFLGNTQFTISCRGGSSIIDTKGKIASRLANLKKYFPKISEDTAFHLASIGEAKFGVFDAISPRLFDAAIMGVCQILLEDDYIGMEPWVHYIPLKPDFSNIEEIFSAMQEPGIAEGIVQRSQEYLLDTSRFSYQHMVDYILHKEINTNHEEFVQPTFTDIDVLVGGNIDKNIQTIRALTWSAGNLTNKTLTPEVIHQIHSWKNATEKHSAFFPEMWVIPWTPVPTSSN